MEMGDDRGEKNVTNRAILPVSPEKPTRPRREMGGTEVEATFL